MSLNSNSVHQMSFKRLAYDDNIMTHDSSITSKSSDTSSESCATTTVNTSRKRPRNSVNDLHVVQDLKKEPIARHPVTCNEDDDCSIDSVLDAVNTILRDDDDDEVDTVEMIQSRLPAPDAANDDPDDYLLMLLQAMFPQLKVQVKSSVDLNEYFPTPTEEQMSKYTTEVVTVVRLNDANAMNEYYKTHGRASLDCCNRFGEGLLNMACRRGFTETVQYLLSPEIQLNVRVRDDGGRTPLHDACWYPEPQLEVCTRIIQQDPSLFLVADKRGYTPFQYARQNDWPVWRQFLYTNYQALYSFGTKPEVVNTFLCK